MHLAEVLNSNVDPARITYNTDAVLVAGGGTYADQNI